MSTNTHYVVSATIQDARIGSSDTRKTDTKISVLATDETDAGNIVIEFFTNSSIDSSLADGVHALCRSARLTGAGAMRSVRINSVEAYVASAAVSPATATPTADAKPAGRTPRSAKAASDAIQAAKAAVAALENEVETEASESITTTETTPPVETTASPVADGSV